MRPSDVEASGGFSFPSAGEEPMASNARLLFVSSEYPPGPGGIGTHAHQICRHWAAAGRHVEVATPQDYVTDDRAAAFNAEQDVVVHRLRHDDAARGRLNRLRGRLQAVDRLVEEGAIDALLASGDPAIYWSMPVARRRKLPILVVEHGRRPGWPEAYLKRWAFRRADAVVAVSRYSLGRLRSLGIRAEGGEVIHNGADAEFFHPDSPWQVAGLRRELGVEKGPLLVTTGSIHRRKGQELVVRALPRIRSVFPGLRYAMAGLGHELESLMAVAEGLGVADITLPLGAIPAERLRTLYSACDLFLMTSRNTPRQFEGFGIAVIEAALCGRPALVTAGSGLAEAVDDGNTGRVVPPEDPEAIAEGVIDLLRDSDRLRRLGTRARRRAVDGFTWRRVAEAYGRVMDEICAR